MAFRQSFHLSNSRTNYKIDKMEQPDPYSWVIDQVVDQLCNPSSQTRKHLNIKPAIDKDDVLAPALRENDIDGEALLSLEDVDVKDDLGIHSFGQRREIRKIIQHLRSISTTYKQEVQQPAKEESPVAVKTRLYSEREESDSAIPNSTPSVEPEPKKRRIAPQLISTEPLQTPDDFNPGQLSPHWRDFLDRHHEEENEEVLRPYNESDAELAIDSDDSLNDELEFESLTLEDESEGRLSDQAVNQAIDEAIAEFQEAWKMNKQPKKHKAASRRWLRAAKAGTRKPQQHYLQGQIDRYRSRLAKLREALSDRSMEHNKVEDVTRLCKNLEATVDDISEFEYYLEVLSSNTAPIMPIPHAATAQPEEILEVGEEILASSESEEDEDEDEAEQTEENFLLHGSDAESGVILDYDPADEDWDPQPQSMLADDRDTEIKPGDHMVLDSHQAVLPKDRVSPKVQPLEFAGYPVMPSEQPMLIPGSFPEFQSKQSHYSSAEFGNLGGATPMQLSQPSTPQRERYSTIEPQSPYQEITSHEPFMNLDEVDSDLDLPRLPQSRYGQQGGTFNDAIVLGSSPSGSEHSIMSGMRTPPLNPTTPVKSKPASRPEQFYPNIQETRAKPWRDVQSPFEALCKIVYRHPRTIASAVLEVAQGCPKDEQAGALKYRISEIQDVEDADDIDLEEEPEYVWAFFYIVYACNKGERDVFEYAERYYDMAFEMADDKAVKFNRILQPLLQHYISSDTNKPDARKQTLDHGQQFSQSRREERGLLAFPTSSTSLPRGYHHDRSMSITDTETEVDQEDYTSPLKKRKRHIEQSQEALSQQQDDQSRVYSQEARRKELMQRMQSTNVTGEVRQVPINTDEPIVYLDPHIARRVKEHQIEGIQFIWRELINAPKHQGCLLAHTMGLGKTMQVISFLVTLAQTNRTYNDNDNPVPAHLRSSKVLVVCPASLVDNWYDEILMWTPPNDPNLLGSVYRVAGLRSQKLATVQHWHQYPGILIISYESLKALLRGGKNSTDEEIQFMERTLLEEPAVVIADEAHKLKNAKSAVNSVAKRFKTTSRIALTGSPLNNHLEEYHTMIDWIAPGYLGSMVQFKAKYSEPIERGLYAEASKHEKRTSVKKLYVLKHDLAPKIDRKDISAIAKDMPQKTEFFITIPLTDIQMDLYRLIVQYILAGVGGKSKSSNAQLWTWLAILSLLCNHPSCLIRKLQEKNPDAVAEAFIDEDEEGGLPAEVDLSATGIEALLPRFLDNLQSCGAINQIDEPSLSYRAQVTRQLVFESVSRGEKILIFSHSIPTLNFLDHMLEDMNVSHLRIDGSTKVETRQNFTKHFNEKDDYMAFLISTRAGGLGLNLQGANRVIIYDFGFNPSWEEQAIGRAYRLGQKKPVFVYRFRTGGTFEEAMYNKSIFKTQLFSRVVDQKNVIRHASKKIEDYIFEPRDAERDEAALIECSGKDALLDNVMQQSPEVIRNLILTETFQREDEDDVLDDKEQKELEDEVEMEQLLRTNPTEYRVKVAQKQREADAQRARNPPIVPVHINQLHAGYGTNATGFEDIWNPQTLNPPGLPSVSRGLHEARWNVAHNMPNAEFMVRSDSSGISSNGGGNGQNDPKRGPGCEQQ